MAILHKDLIKLLVYEPNTGYFLAKETNHNHTRVKGQRVGSLNLQGYRMIKLHGRSYSEQRLAWFYMTTTWPSLDVDHVDRNRENNAWKNLRLATNSENQGNINYPPGVVGLKGVSKSGSRFRAMVCVNRVKRHLGVYATAEEAHEVYKREHIKLFGDFSVFKG